MKILGKLVDIHARNIYDACITIDGERIRRIEKCDIDTEYFIMPGLIDSHIHIESSMVTPSAFAVEAVKSGTVAVVSDPHEIANVCGVEGVNFMINDGNNVPLRFYFGAPSCVPATSYETSGASVNINEVEELLGRSEIHYLSEMMNFPGVVNGDKEAMGKIKAAIKAGKPVDGHAPGLMGEALKKYVSSGISTDHECSSLDEAREKISLGMKILIREGSAARNMDNLKELINSHPDMVMLCSDDLHPEMLINGHINKLIARLISEGFDVYDVIRSATINPVLHYKLGCGLLREGDAADFVIVKDLQKMEVVETWIGGSMVYGKKQVLFEPANSIVINRFNCSHINAEDIIIDNNGDSFRVIEAHDGELLTKQIITRQEKGSTLISDLKKDYLKIVVKDRYSDAPPQTGFVKGFKLAKGAFASSVAHDSHNIVCVGVDDADIVAAVNAIVDMEGGLSVSTDKELFTLQLDIGGIMTSGSCYETGSRYKELSKIVKNLGCTMAAPYMTLAFMALLVIPELKIGDRGLFDVQSFRPVTLFV
ncbi:MAG TPA: adenine deaminase [Bacteroidales bacterium]|nr:adenine deaminase [Bacteroidales bacterium]